MAKTALIIFYSNPTYLNHPLLSPVSSDVCNFLSLPWLCTGPRLCLFMAPELFNPKWGKAPSSNNPHGSNSEAELSWAKPTQKKMVYFAIGSTSGRGPGSWGLAQADISLQASHEIHSRLSSSVLHGGGAANVPEGVKSTKHWPNGHIPMALCDLCHLGLCA